MYFSFPPDLLLIMLLMNRACVISSFPIHKHFIYFPCIIALARISRMMLNWVDRADISFLILFEEKHSVLHPRSANSRKKHRCLLIFGRWKKLVCVIKSLIVRSLPCMTSIHEDLERYLFHVQILIDNEIKWRTGKRCYKQTQNIKH